MTTASQKPPLVRLMLGAIGVVFGDIGTSPLYTMKESFAGPHPLALDALHVYGVVSLIFWSVMLIVSFKYVTLMMRADNKGEGGSLALLTLVSNLVQGTRFVPIVALLGIFAAALFYGDSMITPAISVLSAVEGLEVVAPGLDDYIVPITVVILIGLFLVQKHGTAAMGRLFGPVTLVWFLTLAALGIASIVEHPEILWALNPMYAVKFFLTDQWLAFLALGSVVLALTGAEALYADMGHFGRPPIRRAWFFVVLPALMLNYFGQGALLISEPSAIDNPFYRLAPDWALWPVLGLATLATIIASQAVISGAFSVTRQAVQLGYLPRLKVLHTSEAEIGQIYVPFVNWALLVAVILLVLGFGSSTNLAAAYGVAVTGTMFIDTLLLSFVVLLAWKIPRWQGIAILVVFLIVDISFLGANLTKIPDGGWFPLFAGLGLFVLLTTWKRGRQLVRDGQARDAIPVETFLSSLSPKITRVQGAAVYMSGNSQGVPHALLHNLKHNKVLHERVLFVTVANEDMPSVPAAERATVTKMSDGIHRVIVRYGFMESPHLPRDLAAISAAEGLDFDPLQASYFLGRETLVAAARPKMPIWRLWLFLVMARNAISATEFFRIPTDRVVELGVRVAI